MGAIIALFLVLSTLTACAGDTMSNLKNDPSQLPIPPEVIVYIAETERYTDEIQDDDGKTLVRCEYSVPILRTYRADGTEITDPQTQMELQATEIAKTFNDKFSEWTAESDAQKLAQDAKNDRAWREELGQTWEDANAYTATLTCSIYQTDKLISVSASYDSYTGGAHPNTLLMSWNFDLTVGTFLKPETLAEDGQEFSAMVQQEIVAQVRQRAAENDLKPGEFFWETYEQIAGDWCSYAVTFNERGMTVGYSPYEIACYAAGAQEFSIPYEQLRPYLGSHGIELLDLQETEE